MIKFTKILLINFIVFVGVILFLEIILGNKIYPNKLNCGYLLCSADHSYKNSLYQGNDYIRYKKDKYGFRGLRKKVNQIDILTVGGSTTDERYLETKDTWSEQLELLININYPNLNFEVANAGIDGQSTYGHIWNFKNWFPKIQNFKTKYIFFYIGLNEYFSDQKHVYDQGTKYLNFFQKIKLWFKENNGIIFRTYDIVYRNFFLKDTLNVGHKIRTVNYRLAKKNFQITDENIIDLNNRLDKLIMLTKKINAIPIFVTQKSLRSKLIDNKIYSIDEFDYMSKEKIISEIIINNCEKNQIFCVDLFNKIKFSNDSLYDLVHASPEGAKTIAKTIFADFDKILNKN